MQKAKNKEANAASNIPPPRLRNKKLFLTLTKTHTPPVRIKDQILLSFSPDSVLLGRAHFQHKTTHQDMHRFLLFPSNSSEMTTI